MQVRLKIYSYFVLALCFFNRGSGQEPEDCSEIDGTFCGDPAFEECPDGEWDYGLDCDPYYHVCCVPNSPPTTTTTDPPYTGPTFRSTSTRPTPEPGSCGQRPEGQYIVGGEEAGPNSWPWMVSYQLDYWEQGGSFAHHCGGSLLNEQWVLTAAHCYVKSTVPEMEHWRVILGMHGKIEGGPVDPTPPAVISSVSEVVVHPLYDPEVDGSPNDLLLIKLTEPVTLNEYISPVCLPNFKEQDYINNTCVATGWGLTKGTGDEQVLNQVDLTVITNDLCDFKWEEGSGRVGLIKESHICVWSGEIEGPCNGDSGGPLNCYVNGEWQMAGATSFGAAGCEEPEAPNVYTRISHFLDWIDETINQ